MPTSPSPAGPPPKPQSDFRVFSAASAGQTFYLIESTAPDAVEQSLEPGFTPPVLVPVDPDQAVEDIATFLTPEGRPEVDANLVVMVHGFNNPRSSVLNFYNAALHALNDDAATLFDDDRKIVCIGYRWPSERIGSILSSSLSALPVFPLILLIVALLIVAASVWVVQLGLRMTDLWQPDLARNVGWLIALDSFVLVLAIILLAILRAIVYFRDVYRATNFGVPDLVEVIRQIDRAAVERVRGISAAEEPRRNRIALSFIGHSMGGLVVTNAIRILSDVFDPAVIRTTLSGKIEGRPIDRPDASERVTGKIGHVFTLMRFVLASPDIPAETLLAGRANFLASALRRFREAYLFSSEGDVVLRLISTTVNYFSFPTRTRPYGYRLGNAEILTSGFDAGQQFEPLSTVRVGSEKLIDLAGKMTPINDDAGQVAATFSYFDCTDYVEGTPPRGMLTEALDRKRNNPMGALSYADYLRLLLRYLLRGKLHIDVHGGYFQGETTRRLIYRLACLGFGGAAQAYGGPDSMLQTCSQRQIRVLLSTGLLRKPSDTRASFSEAREKMDLGPAR